MVEHSDGAEPVLAEGTRVGDFRICGLLGEGAMGQVYLAQDTTLGRRVALKLIKRSAMQHDGVARFLEEARATASFNHPHIVTLHAVGEHGGRPYLALEYIDGESLRARLGAGPLPVREALRCGRAVADAIAEAHRRGLVHADLKPENIVISSDGRVRVVDFGLAKLAGGTPYAMSGTPAYMAPERWRGAPPTGAIDVWSLGVTLYELILGHRPASDDELARLSFVSQALELADLPAAPWAQLVRDCLAFDPEARPTAAVILRRLTALLEPHASAATAATVRADEVRALADAAASAQDQTTTPVAAPPQTHAGPLAGIDADRLGVGSKLDGRGPEELEAMRRIGATSVELYRRYLGVLHALHATYLPDLRELATSMRAIVAAEPGWAHPYALLAIIEGQTTDSSRATIAAARSFADPGRDPSGMLMIDALDSLVRGEPEAAFEIVREVFRQNAADLLAGVPLWTSAFLAQRTEEAVAAIQQLHARFPELLFGMDLAEVLRWEGREAEADRVIRDWVAAHPDNLVARVELVRIEALAGRLDEARARTREVFAIHGDREDALPELFEVLVASSQLSEARAIAHRMLTGSPLLRARGRLRVAMIAVFEGRFAAAYDAVRRAISEHRAFGMQSELTQCLELARSIAPLVADVAAQGRHAEELAAVFSTMIGNAAVAAAIRFELALLDDGGAAPSLDDYLAGLEDGPMRDTARRCMLRAAAIAGCGSPRAAVAAGFSAFEVSTASLVAFGQCARQIGELELARRSLERATRQWSSTTNNQSSPYHAVLARFHLAQVLEELGEHPAARAAYEAFLRYWAAPDRPVPEVAAARKAVGRLAAGLV